MPSLKSIGKKSASYSHRAVSAATPPVAGPSSSPSTKPAGIGGTLLSGRKPSPSYRRRANRGPMGSVSFGGCGDVASESLPNANVGHVTMTYDDGNERDCDDEVAVAAAAEEEGDHDDGDPLLSLFRVHNTNRVKFNLSASSANEADADTEDRHQKGNGGNSPMRMGATEKFKRFVRSTSFKRKSTSTPPNLMASCLLSRDEGAYVGPEDADVKHIASMMEPTPLRKMSSFLGNMRGGSHEKTITSQDSLADGLSKRTIDNCNSISKSKYCNLPRLLKKAQRAHKKSFRYRVAMKYYLLALKEMTNAGYSDSDQLMVTVLKSLNDVHHAQSTVTNSANIVRMGIEHEDDNQLVKALRMYTIAYRMRRDSLGVDHPSLAVLLNMMGSVQVKRGEYGEAMKIYELSLNGRPDENGGEGRRKDQFRNRNPLTTSVTLRDMGMILEHKGNEEKALKFYHASLRYAVKSKVANEQKRTNCKSSEDGGSDAGSAKSLLESRQEEGDWLETDNVAEEPFSLEEVRMARSTTMGKDGGAVSASVSEYGRQMGENGEMELFLEKRFDRWALSEGGVAVAGKSDSTKFYYDALFASVADEQQQLEKVPNGEGPDVDIAMTLHQIGQIHRRSHRYGAALSSYNASLRGMKEVLGTQHGNIAAILGNIGNLYMEIGDYDEAFNIYQEVLGIETIHLGLSHPEVAVTLHNIATIECSRGNFPEGVSLYKQVVDMQKIRYGTEHLTVAITLSCLADAYEKLRNVQGAIKTYEEALKIRIAVLGKSHLDVGRLMHKLGRLASSRKDYAIADIYMNRASEIYIENKLRPDHVFVREMDRDNADIQAGLAFDRKK